MKIDRNNRELKRVPVLSNDELRKLARVMYFNEGDELQERRFWKEIYKKRGIEYT